MTVAWGLPGSLAIPGLSGGEGQAEFRGKLHSPAGMVQENRGGEEIRLGGGRGQRGTGAGGEHLKRFPRVSAAVKAHQRQKLAGGVVGAELLQISRIDIGAAQANRLPVAKNFSAAGPTVTVFKSRTTQSTGCKWRSQPPGACASASSCSSVTPLSAENPAQLLRSRAATWAPQPNASPKSWARVRI